ncbi:MAG: CBS domain-containing protein [Thermoplasmata archaeon]
MRWSFRIATILGIPVKIHLTFLILLPLFAWIFAFQNFHVLVFDTAFGVLAFDTGFGGVDLSFLASPIDDAVRWTLGSLAAIFFFASVLFHELVHSYVAIRYGATISGITLIIFGGISEIEDIPRQPAAERNMALAGPATNFLIAGVGYAVLLVLAPFRTLSTGLEVLTVFFSILVFYNLILGLFNLIPAFPMDGGRVLRASLARNRSYISATETAATVGKVFAVLFAVVGILTFQFILILIAAFVYMGAGGEAQLTKLTVALEGVYVDDIMTKEVDTVTSDSTVAELMERIAVERHMGYPVVNGEVRGLVTFQDAVAVPPDRRDRVRVGDISSKKIVTIEPRAQALDAMKRISDRKIGRLLVMDGGQLVGILTRTDLVRAVSIYQAQRGL